MDNIKIQTTQNVEIDYVAASVGDRILATLIDYLIILAYFFLWMIFGAVTEGRIFENVIVVIIMVLPVILYDLVLEIIYQGKSFGKIVMKIKVVKIDGTQPTFSSYLIRWVFRIVDTRLFSGVVALITIVFNGKGQRLGDIAAGTTVIKMKQKVTLNDTILNKTRPEYTIVFPEVARLSDNDIDIIKDVMKMCIATGNFEALDKLVKKTKSAMGVTTNMPHKQFLATVVQDYSHYQFDK